MKNIYKEHLRCIELIENNSEKLNFLSSVLRSLLQLAVVSSFEIIKLKAPSDEIDLTEFVDRFSRPADGLPVEILDVVVPFIRSYVDPQFLSGWFEKSKGGDEPLNKQLNSWTWYRNSRPAHGVLDRPTELEWAPKATNILEECINVFQNIIPVFIDSELRFPKEFGNGYFDTPVVRNGKAIVIRSVVAGKGIWRLKGQVLCRDQADEFTVELQEDNVFSLISLNTVENYKLAEVVSNGADYSIFHNVPIRQTATFEGRAFELAELLDWMDDEDSRHCLVFGDGGYGKTTMVLELLNQLIEGRLDFKRPLPEIVTYHTAKMTKWTEQGLTRLSTVSKTMDQFIRELMKCIFTVLPTEWYKASGRALLDKAIAKLKEEGYTRDDILMVLDNTETLASKQDEVVELGALFKDMGKRLGRVIITSRRREIIEARPIVIEGLTEIESVRLMQRLAKEYSAQSIIQAGEGTLRKVSEQLMNKPLLLDALVKHISHTDNGIKASIDKIFKKSNDELYEFLYEDAWIRLSDFQKEVFLVLIHVDSPLNQNSVGSACKQVGIQHTEFQAGLVETHFSNLVDYGKTYSLEFVSLARKFFYQEFGKLNDVDKKRIKVLSKSVDKSEATRIRIEHEYKADRVAEAYRSEYAKSASILVTKNEIPEAIDMYELAIEDDPLNAALHDRFSWLIYNKTPRLDYAKTLSEKSIALDPHSCRALVNIGIINYRLKDLGEGDKYIGLAGKEGRPFAFCKLRMSVGRFHYAIQLSNLDRVISLLEEAEGYLSEAEGYCDRGNGYNRKTYDEIKKYQKLVGAKLTIFRSRKTKSLNRKKRVVKNKI